MPGLFPTLSTGASFRYPVDREINTRSKTFRFCDFSEQSFRMGGGISRVVFDFTWNRISTADKNTIRAFYGSQNGTEATDWSLFFDNVLYNNCQFVGKCEPQYIDTNLWSVTLRVRTTAGGTTSVIPFPHGKIVSALLHLTSSFAAGGGGGNFGGGASFDPVGTIFPVPTWFHSTSSWSTRTDSIAVDPVRVMTQSLYLLVLVENDGLPAAPSSPDVLTVTDSWIDVVYEDTTTGVYRPGGSSNTVSNATGSVTVTSPTQAVLSVSSYGGAGLGGAFFNINSYAPGV